jgi:hypothetical protein
VVSLNLLESDVKRAVVAICFKQDQADESVKEWLRPKGCILCYITRKTVVRGMR